MELNRRESSKWSLKYIIVMSILTSLALYFKNYIITRDLGGLAQLDSYKLAFGEIILFANLFSSALMYASIVGFRRIEEIQGRQAVLDAINNLVNLVLVFFGPMTLVLMLAFGLNIFRIQDLAFNKFMVLGLPIIGLNCIKVVYTSFLQMKHGFGSGPKGNLARAVIYLVVLVFFSDRISLEVLMLLGVLGAGVQVLIAYEGTRKNQYKYEFKLDLKAPYLLDILRPSLAIFLVLAMYDYTLLFKHRSLLELVVINIFISALLTVIYPLMVEEYQEMKLRLDNNYRYFKYIFIQAFNFILFIVAPLGLVLLFGSSQIKILYYLEHIDRNLFIYFGLGIFAMSLMPLVLRTMMAYNDYLAPIYTMTLALVVGLVLEYVLAYKNVAYDIGLLMGSILGLVLIDRRMDFLSKNLNSFRTLLRSLGLMLVFQLAFYLIFRYIFPWKLETRLANMVYLGLMTVLGLGLYAGYYIKNRKREISQ